MTKSQLIAKIARQTGYSVPVVENVLNCFVDDTIEALQNGEKVTIAGFGRFEMRQRQAEGFTNPKTKQKGTLTPRATPGFKVSGLMKQKIEQAAGDK